MKNIVTIDIDTDRDTPIYIGKPPELLEATGWNDDPKLADFATLLEGVCTLIHVLDNKEIQKSHVSLKKAIEHLERGFADASYQTK